MAAGRPLTTPEPVLEKKKELQNYKMEELLAEEPQEGSGHDGAFADILIH